MKTLVGTDFIRIAGYAALFDVADLSQDTILKGAFARTLAERRDSLPLYWQHRADQQIGLVELAEEDQRGLRIIARVENMASRAAAALRDRSVSGLSFGYRARLYRRFQSGRILEDVDLFEISLVTHPVQHEARIHLMQ